MTKAFGTRVQCPHCGLMHTQEVPFKRRMRNCQDLDARQFGVVQYDCDILLHNYMMAEDKRGKRKIQCIMFIEVKSFGASLDRAQCDTLSLFSQVLRNRKPNMYQKKIGRHVKDHTPPCKAFSHLLKQYIRLYMYGGHLLRMSGSDPFNSDWMTWDEKAIGIDRGSWDKKREISRETLIKLLRFELDPDWRWRRYGLTFQPTDHRRRSSDFKEYNTVLPGLEDWWRRSQGTSV